MQNNHNVELVWREFKTIIEPVRPLFDIPMLRRVLLVALKEILKINDLARFEEPEETAFQNLCKEQEEEEEQQQQQQQQQSNQIVKIKQEKNEEKKRQKKPSKQTSSFSISPPSVIRKKNKKSANFTDVDEVLL